MSYKNKAVAEVAKKLESKLKKDPTINLLKTVELKALFDQIPSMKPQERGAFGKEVNQLKKDLEKLMDDVQADQEELEPIDVTAPFDVNTPSQKLPRLLSAEQGSRHPLTQEIETLVEIFSKMGFNVEQSRQIDDEYNMFDTLNFPKGHPARDHYDTFYTKEGYVAPSHTSTMQNRYLKKYKKNLENDEPIAVIIPDRVYRNEDLDARHDHTFYQFEGLYVYKKIHAGMLIATLQAFFKEFYQKDIETRTQPFYFPFTEPSFEFTSTCVFCDGIGCNICSHTGWIELGGCGMIHPNVLKMAGIDPEVYTGFAWGFGIERPVMLKKGIEDIRHFHSAKLDFLRQFK